MEGSKKTAKKWSKYSTIFSHHMQISRYHSDIELSQNIVQHIGSVWKAFGCLFADGHHLKDTHLTVQLDQFYPQKWRKLHTGHGFGQAYLS